MTSIEWRVDNGIAHLTFTNSKQRNALDEEWWLALADVLDELEQHEDLRVVTVTGVDDAFSAGGDIARMVRSLDAMDAGTFEESERDRMDRNALLLRRWISLPLVRVAAVNGPAVGAGLAFALSCDHRIMVDDTFLESGFSRLGLPGDLGVSYFLPQIVGRKRAQAWLLRSRRVSAIEALSTGLVDEVCARHELDARLGETAASFAALAPEAIRWVLQPENAERELAVVLERETDGTLACKQSNFHREAVLQFMERSVGGSKANG